MKQKHVLFFAATIGLISLLSVRNNAFGFSIMPPQQSPTATPTPTSVPTNTPVPTASFQKQPAQQAPTATSTPITNSQPAATATSIQPKITSTPSFTPQQFPILLPDSSVGPAETTSPNNAHSNGNSLFDIGNQGRNTTANSTLQNTNIFQSVINSVKQFFGSKQASSSDNTVVPIPTVPERTFNQINTEAAPKTSSPTEILFAPIITVNSAITGLTNSIFSHLLGK